MPIPDPQLFSINGTPLSWASTRVTLDGVPRRRLTAISFEEKLERELVRGAVRSGIPLGLTYGDYSVTGLSLTLLLDEGAFWRSYLAAQALLQSLSLGAGSAKFTLGVQLVEGINIVDLFFNQCQIGGGKLDLAKGIEGAVMQVPLDCISMTINGTTLYDATRDL